MSTNTGPIPARRKSGCSTQELCSDADEAVRSGRPLSGSVELDGVGSAVCGSTPVKTSPETSVRVADAIMEGPLVRTVELRQAIRNALKAGVTHREIRANVEQVLGEKP